MLYIFSVILCVIIIALVNIFTSAQVYNYEFYHIIFWSCLTTIIVIFIDSIFATLVRWVCPKKWFEVNKGHFKASKREARFYEKIGIKKWKDKVLELGSLTSFKKNKIAEPNNLEYVSRYILEANYGVSVHLSCMIFGFAAMFCCPMNLWLPIGLPVCIVNLFYNFLSFSILRYNLPKLYVLYKYNSKKQAQKEIIKTKCENL